MRILFLLLSSLFALSLSAQKHSKPPSSLKGYKLPIEARLQAVATNNSISIIIVDARPDTSKIGVISFYNGTYLKLVCDKNFSEIRIPTGNHTQRSLLFVLRKLWLQETSLADERQTKISTQKAGESKPYSECYARIEVYEKADSLFIPLFRLDSVFTEAKSIQAAASELIMVPFTYCLHKSVKAQPNKKRMSFEEVKNFSFAHKLNPQQKAVVTHKGVFYSYTDFLANRPDTTPFEVRFNALTDEVFQSTGGDQKILEKFWGLSDGKNIFIHLGANVFQLHSIQNTYELWGFKGFRQNYTDVGPIQDNLSARIATPIIDPKMFNDKRVVAQLKPMQLDPDTGNVY